MAEQRLATRVQVWESREVGPIPGMPPSCHLTAGRFLLSPRAFSFPFLKGGGETLPISWTRCFLMLLIMTSVAGAFSETMV